MANGTTTIIKSEDGKTVFVEHMPGNGTRYIAVATKIPEAVPYFGGRWLVAFPEMPGTAWCFQEGCVAHPTYVAEKLGYGRNYKFSADRPDTHEMCKVIAMVVPGATHYAETDDTGHFPHQKVLNSVD